MKFECCECGKLVDEDDVILRFRNGAGRGVIPMAVNIFAYCKECYDRIKKVEE